jgi:long-chain fatty acid transport protein
MNNTKFAAKEAIMKRLFLFTILLGAALATPLPSAFGQGYGSDAQNVMAPASGGMAGVSTARPQDVPSAVFGNPATLSQFQGTQFTLGGGWIEGYPTVTDVRRPDLGSATSRTQGFVASEIAVAQDLRSLGMPGTLGLGLAGLSGMGAEYRGQAPNLGSPINDISGEYLVLGLNIGVGMELAEGLSAGATATLGTGFSQLGLVQSTAMVHDYALRGTLGLAYDLDPCNTVGAYYQTKLGFTFPNAFLLPVGPNAGSYRDINIDQPETFGFGYANRSLMDGNLLLAADVYYKLWEGANLWGDVMNNQWAFAFGSQLTRGKNKYRLGYSWNTNPMNHSVTNGLDGLPVAKEAVNLMQATSLCLINQNRITAGIGREDFLVQGLDLDLFAGGLLSATDQFGNFQASVAMYYVGLGLTWRYGACGGHCADSAETCATCSE